MLRLQDAAVIVLVVDDSVAISFEGQHFVWQAPFKLNNTIAGFHVNELRLLGVQVTAELPPCILTKAHSVLRRDVLPVDVGPHVVDRRVAHLRELCHVVAVARVRRVD